MDKQRAKEQMQRSSNSAVQRAASRLRGQWSARENGRCHHHSYEELARAVGLGTDPRTLGEIKRWVQEQKLPEPSRPQPRKR